jgi:transcriptional regulator with XRE-family HTH domain
VSTLGRVARRPNLATINQPLRLLRAALSEVGDVRYPITQEQLAELVDLSPGTIKGLENGHREMTDTIWLHVVLGTGAMWDEERGRWVCAPGFGDPDEPFTRAFFLTFREKRLQRPEQAVNLEGLLVLRLCALLQRASDRDWLRLIIETQRFLDRCVRELGIKDLKISSGELFPAIQQLGTFVEGTKARLEELQAGVKQKGQGRGRGRSSPP